MSIQEPDNIARKNKRNIDLSGNPVAKRNISGNKGKQRKTPKKNIFIIWEIKKSRILSKWKKIEDLRKETIWLGHEITAKGTKTNKEKIKAILQLKCPT